MNKSVLSRLSLYFHTVKHLRPIQLLNRLQRLILKPKLVEIAAKAMPRSNAERKICDLIPRKKEFFEDGTVRFLNVSDNFSTAGWGTYKQSLLWHYNLHYFNDLRQIKPTSLQAELIASWISDVDPGSAISWDPYPTSLRAVNWILWHLQCERIGSSGLSNRALDSLRTQLSFLSQRVEWHLLGNHLFENGKTLLIGGMFFEGKQANRFRDQGTKILSAEIDEQILSDGAHFELSPMYHAIVLEGLLEVLAIAQLYPHRLNRNTNALIAKVGAVVPNMLSWLGHMVHGDGDLAFFNDTALGIAATYKDLRTFAERLGISTETKSATQNKLTESGYCRLSKGKALIIADFASVGPDYLPGHAHADTLSFEFSIGMDRIFVNSGTSIYEAGSLRCYQRSTMAHNTVEVSGENSSETWGAFRVARRAEIQAVSIKSTKKLSMAEAAHDGYQRLKPPLIHKRRFELTENSMAIVDEIDKETSAKVRFYLHPDCRAEELEDGTGLKVSFSKNLNKEMTIKVLNADLNIRDSSWYPEFGKQRANQCIELTPTCTQCTTKVIWQ